MELALKKYMKKYSENKELLKVKNIIQ